MKLAIGTAQFGLAYGAFNRVGQIPMIEVKAILDMAKSAGIKVLDTARAYGNSEAVLGELGVAADFRVVTKVPALTDTDPTAQLRKLFTQSLAHLRVPTVHGLLLHRAVDLLGPQGAKIWRTLEELRDSGRVSCIGFSAYGPDEARVILDRYPVQLIQLPLNVFDTRHIESGTLDLCQSRGIEVHVRSVFLQGFALSNPARLEGHLSRWRELLAQFHAHCADLQVTPLQAALRQILDLPQVDQIVLGVDGCAQLTEILQATEGQPLSLKNLGNFACVDQDLIDPSRWR